MGISENLGHGLGHGQTPDTLVRSSLVQTNKNHQSMQTKGFTMHQCGGAYHAYQDQYRQWCRQQRHTMHFSSISINHSKFSHYAIPRYNYVIKGENVSETGLKLQMHRKNENTSTAQCNASISTIKSLRILNLNLLRTRSTLLIENETKQDFDDSSNVSFHFIRKKQMLDTGGQTHPFSITVSGIIF